jgi:hypothetical protein
METHHNAAAAPRNAYVPGVMHCMIKHMRYCTINNNQILICLPAHPAGMMQKGKNLGMRTASFSQSIQAFGRM